MLKKPQNNPMVTAWPLVDFHRCPAKTFSADDGTVRPGRSVFNHCEIVGNVAHELIQRYPEQLRDRLFPPGSELAAAGHDIGKVSPYFVEKIRSACHPEPRDLPVMTGISDPALEMKWGGHAGVSYVTTRDAGVPQHIPEILGQHHGSLQSGLDVRRADNEQFGGESWRQERERLIAALKDALKTDWPIVQSFEQSRLLAGLTSVADWIGSGMFFEDPEKPWQPAIAQALDAAGFIRPEFSSGVTFHDIFGFQPNAMQIAMAETVQGPGSYVLEAPMGMGKTEGALYAAYRILEAGQASGIYFALPTQITSNKIYDRFRLFLNRILAQGTTNRPMLLHSGAWLLEHTDMGEEGQPGGSWFHASKRGLLAPFGVGTIDQALMAAMGVKHGFVRAFGLAGKVVILDEVHTYDAYTGTILRELVALLRALQCTVIVLSATLTAERRNEILGLSAKVAQTDAPYPVITALPPSETPIRVPIAPPEDASVHLKRQSNDVKALEEALVRAERGEQVLWIENTVREAQWIFSILSARTAGMNVECGLLHSKFTRRDREGIEAHWIDRLGKKGWAERGKRGRILVGTQVLEQSLDIDADFLLTRMTPIDLLLQRLGRLWRHAGTPRPPEARHEAWVLAPEQLEQAVEDPREAFGKSAMVYSTYVLCRSFETLDTRFGQALRIPSDIPGLIAQTYAERPETGAMARWLVDLEAGTRHAKGRRAMKQLALTVLAQPTAQIPDERASTRYGMEDSADVLIFRSLKRDAENRRTLLETLVGETIEIPWDRHRLQRDQWRRISARLMRESVPVAQSRCPLALSRSEALELGFGHCLYLGTVHHPQDLPIALRASENGRLTTLHGEPAGLRHDLYYQAKTGYRYEKRED